MSTTTSQIPRTQPEPGAEAQPSHIDTGAEIARLKRRLAASQEEVRELTQGKVKRPLYAHLFPPLSVICLNYSQDNCHNGTRHPTPCVSIRIP